MSPIGFTHQFKKEDTTKTRLRYEWSLVAQRLHWISPWMRSGTNGGRERGGADVIS